MKRCGKRYGRKRLICGRLYDHYGQHAIRPSLAELQIIIARSRGARESA